MLIGGEKCHRTFWQQAVADHRARRMRWLKFPVTLENSLILELFSLLTNAGKLSKVPAAQHPLLSVCLSGAKKRNSLFGKAL
jgi:hypothetical protein